MKRTTKLRRVGKAPISKLKHKLDTLFSRFIRNKYVVDGKLYCYTCGKEGEVKTMHCGHFIPRHYLATRWDEDNCRPQCVGCNVFGRGQQLDFEENLIKEIGAERVNAMKLTRHYVVKLEPSWYEEKIRQYTVDN